MKLLMRLRRVTGVLLFLTTFQTASAFYDPAPQRWINRDPIEEIGGVNLYAFVVNNPTRYADKFGLEHNHYWYIPEITFPDGTIHYPTNAFGGITENGNDAHIHGSASLCARIERLQGVVGRRSRRQTGRPNPPSDFTKGFSVVHSLWPRS